MNEGSFCRFGPRPFVLPAIDLRGGRVVRLVRGRGDAEIGYDAEPVAAARRWIDDGGECLHIIDLGSAFGEADSTDVILAVAREVDVPIQVGGGVRDAARVEKLLSGGVTRVILGTRALRDPDFLGEMLATYGAERVVLAMDIADGRVKVSGWTEESSLDLEGGIRFAVDAGVSQLLMTAIDRDGTLSGPNLELIQTTLDLAAANGLVVAAAGGIGTTADVSAILELQRPALEGVVVGRALYEETVQLGDAVKVVRDFREKERPKEP